MENNFGFFIENKAETAEQLVERFNNTETDKDYLRIDFNNGQLLYKWFDTYEDAIAGIHALTTQDYFCMAIVSESDCVFLDEV